MANILDVSALNRYVQSLLQSDVHLQNVAVQGEIASFNRHHKTGHCYFTLSDAKASIKAVMFRTQAELLTFRPTPGMRVVVRGRISLYERDGSYQIYVDALFQEGVGVQKLALDALKEKLHKEGLFEDVHKKPLPDNAWTVGVISSKSGAALQDILQVANRRNPCAKIILAAVSVQGNGAAAEVTAALKKLDACKTDLIIIARGGGSAEDLAVFNDEVLARTVFRAKTPVLSAIGHEIDFTLLDFVADVRAPTPSAAAELAFTNLQKHLQKEKENCINQGIYIHNHLQLCYNEIKNMHQGLALYAPSRRLQTQMSQLQSMRFAMQTQMHHSLEKMESSFREMAQLAAGLNPYSVLSRGYTVLKKEGKPIDSVRKLQCKDLVEVQFSDGSISAQVTKISPQQEINSHGQKR